MSCTVCQSEYHYQTFCPYKKKKRISQKGKRQIEYEAWRDEIAKPFLDENFGHQCSNCGATGALDVDHIKNRGSRADLKMDLTNVQYLCRPCHISKPDRRSEWPEV